MQDKRIQPPFLAVSAAQTSRGAGTGWHVPVPGSRCHLFSVTSTAISPTCGHEGPTLRSDLVKCFQNSTLFHTLELEPSRYGGAGEWGLPGQTKFLVLAPGLVPKSLSNNPKLAGGAGARDPLFWENADIWELKCGKRLGIKG